MAESPKSTPIPADEPHQCPYRDEIHLVRRLEEHGIEEQTISGKRKDRFSLALAGVALGTALTLGATAIVKSFEVGQIIGRQEERIEQLEEQRPGLDSASVQLGRLETRIEGLEQRLGERFDQIERRLERSENMSIEKARASRRRP